MADLKIDAGLQEEIRRAEAAGQADRAIPVIVECAGYVEGAWGEDRKAELERMERRLGELQARVLDRLGELGASGVQRSALSNALFTALTPAQIGEIAAHPDVKQVRLSREEQVTA